ncbi:hypothetical protein SKAU_G00292900 [Synaphobranchus kaupii]|uniref:Uncharacterized protein n=1 Tax=Synaphobranchus kaupii TaxID=118154 RepID=A0A9Q1EU39_SYNKA|nr:hypothetical protein SKAU_G00292900 [Synaphobranchus kaupii]
MGYPEKCWQPIPNYTAKETKRESSGDTSCEILHHSESLQLLCSIDPETKNKASILRVPALLSPLCASNKVTITLISTETFSHSPVFVGGCKLFSLAALGPDALRERQSGAAHVLRRKINPPPSPIPDVPTSGVD